MLSSDLQFSISFFFFWLYLSSLKGFTFVFLLFPLLSPSQSLPPLSCPLHLFLRSFNSFFLTVFLTFPPFVLLFSLLNSPFLVPTNLLLYHCFLYLSFLHPFCIFSPTIFLVFSLFVFFSECLLNEIKTTQWRTYLSIFLFCSIAKRFLATILSWSQLHVKYFQNKFDIGHSLFWFDL